MDELALFNLNDVIVFFDGFLSLTLAFMLFFKNDEGRLQRRYWNLLALFFLFAGLRAADTLMYWSIDLNQLLAQYSTNLFFLFGFLYFVQGPLLWWYTKAAIYRDFSIRPVDYLHLLPGVLYPVYMIVVFYSLDAQAKLALVSDWGALTQYLPFELMFWAQRISVLVYSIMCFVVLHSYIRHLREAHHTLSSVDLRWLKLLIVGFVCINAWVVLTLVESRFTSWGFDSFMGATESKLRFIYMGALLVHLLKHSTGFAEINVEHTIAIAPVTVEPQHELVVKLRRYMDEEKPYLTPNITVERLAKQLDVSPKLLSSTINSQLNKNFFEMIGEYRIAEAKRCLADDAYRSDSIGEIMKKCGFNSKSVFNQAFKKYVGVTPSHYRQQYATQILASSVK